VGSRSAHWVAESVGSWAQPKSFRARSIASPKCSTRKMGWNDLNKNRTYDVRLRFCRARGLLSTSGGILFATVSGECTRNAKSVVTVVGLARLPMGDATGSGDEGDISSNDCYNGQAKKDCVKSELALDLGEVIGNEWVAGNAERVGRSRCAGWRDARHHPLHFPWFRTSGPCP
jgi:hypothetical protein